MDELVISIDAHGHVEAMYSDELNLAFLGDQRVRRQTDIAFNENTQNWDIHYLAEDGRRMFSPPAPQLCGFASYEHARKVEVAWLNACRKIGVNPCSLLGLSIAMAARQ